MPLSDTCNDFLTRQAVSNKHRATVMARDTESTVRNGTYFDPDEFSDQGFAVGLNRLTHSCIVSEISRATDCSATAGAGWPRRTAPGASVSGRSART